jgi:hypothetical protein
VFEPHEGIAGSDVATGGPPVFVADLSDDRRAARIYGRILLTSAESLRLWLVAGPGDDRRSAAS